MVLRNLGSEIFEICGLYIPYSKVFRFYTTIAIIFVVSDNTIYNPIYYSYCF